MKYFICFLLLFSTGALFAHEDETLFNRVNLQAQASMEIPNDEIQVILAVESEDRDAAKLADKINKTMEWALARIKQGDDIAVRTLSYNTYPVYDKKTIIAWRANQQLELKGTAIADITRLAGDLQEKLQVKSMQFSASDKTRADFENKLIDEAMQAFKQRVELLKKHMDGDNVRVITLDVNTGHGSPRPVYAEARMMSMKADSAPAVEAGTSSLTVTVNGSVQFF
ncbi:MAG: SIMPL domain-containing protein [Gammaproteobacteria bacterium]